MAESAFPFLRATYYLWLARLLKHASAGLTDAPEIVAIGDLHVENFGCWRDADGRLAWGVNDFDEIAALPYTYDLLRLSVSALLAVRERRLPLAEHEVTALVLEGYRDGLASGGKPFVAGARHRWLALPRGAAPTSGGGSSGCLNLASPPCRTMPKRPSARSPPQGAWHPTLHRRTAGLGSLGHRRVVAVGKAADGRVAREVKELSPRQASGSACRMSRRRGRRPGRRGRSTRC